MVRRRSSTTEIVRGGYIGRLLENMPIVAPIDPDKPVLIGLEAAQRGQADEARELYAQFANGLGSLRAADWEVLRQVLLRLSQGVPADRAFMSDEQQPRGLTLGRRRNAPERVQERLDAAVEMAMVLASFPPGVRKSVNAAAKKLTRQGRGVRYLTNAYNELRAPAEAKLLAEES